MEILDFVKQINKITDREIEQRVWDIWICKLPHMNQDNYVSYEEMLDIVKNTKQEEIHGVYANQVLL